MDTKTSREQYVIDTYKRLHPDYQAHIHAIGPGPMNVIVSTPAGVRAAYPIDSIGDRYSLYSQAEADEATLEELKRDGLHLDPPARSPHEPPTTAGERKETHKR